MNAETVDARAELRKPVDTGLTRPPVVALQPVLAQVTEVAEADALRPVVHCLRIRPARPAQPLPQVVEAGFGDLYAKRDDLRTHRGNLTSRSGPWHPHRSLLPHCSLFPHRSLLPHWRRREPAVGPRLVAEFVDELGLCPGVVVSVVMQRSEPSLECAVPGGVVRVSAQVVMQQLIPGRQGTGLDNMQM